jgi:hypothetical protein
MKHYASGRKHKIARIIVSAKQYDENDNPKLEKLIDVLRSFVKENYPDTRFEFIVTPGGFLRFLWPEEFIEWIDVDTANSRKNLQIFYKSAEKAIDTFFKLLDRRTFQRLKEIADYITIGIDSGNKNNGQHIELVAVYDLKREKVIRWTGKFYPTESQKNRLIRIVDLKTHFVKLNRNRVVILGCHDLNVFHPRGQASASPKGWKKRTSTKFRKLCRNFKPDVILQHPHTTDSPMIWNPAWRTIERELPCVKHFASGIKYCDHDFGPPRGSLDKVLEKTKKGDVTDFIYV